MRRVIDFAIRRSRTTILVMIVITLAGIYSRANITIEPDPQIDIPFVITNLILPGISPNDADRMLARPAAPEIMGLEYLKEFTTYAYEGGATLLAEFHEEADVDLVEMEVREAVDRSRPEMPDDMEEPVIFVALADDWPMIAVNLIAEEEVSHRLLQSLATRLADEIEQLSEVREARIDGKRAEIIEALVDPLLLESYGLSIEEIFSVVARNNRVIPAGALDSGDGRFRMSVPGVIETLADFRELPVKTVDGTVITLSDVAEVRRVFRDDSSLAWINGQPGISIAALRTPGVNALRGVEKVKTVVDGFRSELPASINVRYSQDQGYLAQTMVSEVEGNIFTALTLVIIVVVSALGIRSALIVGLAIPVTFMFSFLWLYAIGSSFNFMVMFGMILGLGMLIDGAIVITEYADRKMAEGMERKNAYSLAAREMFWPVTASIFTTLAAFIPLILWPGISGQFMRHLPVTVTIVLIGSLIYSILFGPVMGTLFGKGPSRDSHLARMLRQLEESDPRRLRTLTGAYARLVGKCVQHAPLTLLAGIALLVAIFSLYASRDLGIRFFTEVEPEFGEISVIVPGNLSVQDTGVLVDELQQKLLDIDGIADISASAFRGTTISFGAMRSDVVGRVLFEIVPAAKRDRSSWEIVEEIRAESSTLTGARTEVRIQEPGPSVGKALQIEFRSRDRDALEPAVEQLSNFMRELPGVINLEETLSPPSIEWKIIVDKARAASLGVDVTSVGTMVQFLTEGVLASKYRPDDLTEEIDIRIRFPSNKRALGLLSDLRVNTPQGSVPISSFARIEPAPLIDSYIRKNSVPTEYVYADVAKGVLADDIIQQVRAWIDLQEFPSAIDIQFLGANEEQVNAMAFVQMAFVLSLLLMFVLLVTQFDSFYQAILILCAVVMSTAGVLLGLIAVNMPFSAVLTGLSVVALAGIVVNNNIVLIHTYNQIRRDHPTLDYVQVIVRTAGQRLRPVLVTTITTVFGLLPLANRASVDLIERTIVVDGFVAGFLSQMAQGVVWGLCFATLLTLVMTPAMLALPYHLPRLRPAKRRRHAHVIAHGAPADTVRATS